MGGADGFANLDRAMRHRLTGGDAILVDSSPLARALGTRLPSVDRVAGTVALQFDPDVLFIQGTGVLQVGALSATLDFAMAFASARLWREGEAATVVASASSTLAVRSR